MDNLKYLCYNEELNYSQIILYDIYKNKNQIPYLIIALYNLGLYKKIYRLIEEHEDLLEYFEIQKLLSSIRDNNKPNIKLKDCCKYIETVPNIFLNETSLNFLFKGKIEHTRQEEYFLRAFCEDKKNIEALVLLIFCCDYTEKRILNLIEDDDIEMKKFVNIIFTSVNNGVVSLILANLHSLNLYKENNYIELYSYATYLIDEFPENEIGYITMGRYYLLNENYKKARTFYEYSLKLNSYSKAALLGAGIAFTFLYETKKALDYYIAADKIFTNCFKCKFLLIYELLKNPKNEKIAIHFKKLQNIFIEKEFTSYFCLLVFKLNKFELVGEKLSGEIENQIPKIFYYIYCENYYSAEILLNKIEKNWIFYLINGYILLLKGSFENAKNFIIQSNNHISRRTQIVDDLLKSAQNKNSLKNKNAYTTKVYEFIIFNTLSFFKI